MKSSLSAKKTNGTSYYTAKAVRKKIRLVDNRFTVNDLKEEMDKRKVFGTHPQSTVSNYIQKALKLNLIECIDNNGKTPIYKKSNN